MHPHIPRPRRKATRTCADTAGVVRNVHGEFMWPFTARVNEKAAPIERIAAVAICRRLRDARGQIYAPPQQPSTVHVSEGSKATFSAILVDVRFVPKADIAAYSITFVGATSQRKTESKTLLLRCFQIFALAVKEEFGADEKPFRGCWLPSRGHRTVRSSAVGSGMNW